MEVGKVIKRGEDLLLLFAFHFWSTKMGICYREKAFHAGKKIRKNDFAPSEKYACYAPARHSILIKGYRNWLCVSNTLEINQLQILQFMLKMNRHGLTFDENQFLSLSYTVNAAVSVKFDSCELRRK